jgi:hypothetical protein
MESIAHVQKDPAELSLAFAAVDGKIAELAHRQAESMYMLRQNQTELIQELTENQARMIAEVYHGQTGWIWQVNENQRLCWRSCSKTKPTRFIKSWRTKGSRSRSERN